MEVVFMITVIFFLIAILVKLYQLMGGIKRLISLMIEVNVNINSTYDETPNPSCLKDLVSNGCFRTQQEIELLRYAVFGAGIPKSYGANILGILGDIKTAIERQSQK